MANGIRKSGYVIGVDGGGTKTMGCIASIEGEIKGWALGAASNYQVLGADGVRRVLEPIVGDLLDATGVTRDHILAGVFALSGCGRPEDREAVEKALRREPSLLPRIRAEHDGIAALAGAFGQASGIILISGTGVLCLGRLPNGRTARAGGWGYLLGDEGSGFYIGQQALIAALKAFDGRGPHTLLQEKLEKYFGVDRIDRVIPQVYRKPMERGDFAALAPMVFDTARQDDAVAREIVQRVGQELGLMVKAVATRLGLEGEHVRLALVGNVFRARAQLQPEIEKVVRPAVGSLEVVEPRFAPVLGAVILALEAAGLPVSEERLSALEETAKTMPAPSSPGNG